MDQRTPPKTLAKMTTLSDPAFTNALGIFVRPARRLFLQRGLGLGALGALTLSAGTLATFPATSYASLDAAMKAWAAGDYQGAAKLLKPRADEGDAEAQFNLGLYYFQGLGGDRNYSEAARLFRDAAEQGHIMAANNLGAMNMDGRGVPRNLPEAWYWFAIVAHRGDQAGGVLRDLVASQMTRPQIEQARDRFEGWVAKNDAPWWKKAYRYLTGSH
jgi:TPR repeat protein